MLRSGDVPAGLWLGTAVGALAVSVGLARNPTEEAVVAIVGLVVCALVFVSVVSRILSGRSRSPEVNGESVAALAVPVALLPVDKSHGIFVGLWVPSILALAAVMLLIRRARRP